MTDDNKSLEPIRQNLEPTKRKMPRTFDRIMKERKSDRTIIHKEEGIEVRTEVREKRALPPNISDLYIIKTKGKTTAEEFMAELNKEVLGNYDTSDLQGNSEFGMIVMAFEDMIIAKLDMGPWAHYADSSAAIVFGIIERLEARRVWVCGWSIDRRWTWVEHWRKDPKGFMAKLTETIDAPAGTSVSKEAKERWGIDVAAAFIAFEQAARGEPVRRWLLLEKKKQGNSIDMVSHYAGKRILNEGEMETIEKDWRKQFDRDPKDGPLHLQAFYQPADPKLRAQLESHYKKKVSDYQDGSQIEEDQPEKKKPAQIEDSPKPKYITGGWGLSQEP